MKIASTLHPMKGENSAGETSNSPNSQPTYHGCNGHLIAAEILNDRNRNGGKHQYQRYRFTIPDGTNRDANNTYALSCYSLPQFLSWNEANSVQIDLFHE
jgi:hypothetical protein